MDEVARLVVRARKALANAELAVSARPLLFGQAGVNPQFIAEARGCRVVDTTGRAPSTGSSAGDRRSSATAARRSKTRFESNSLPPTLSMPSALEVEVAEKIIEMIPSTETVRSGKTAPPPSRKRRFCFVSLIARRGWSWNSATEET